MWFEERSWSNLKMSDNILEEWRDLWSYKIDFLVAAVAYTFATTNFLNLPRLVLENGGLAFLAAYGAALVVVVLPILVLELTVGQLIGRAPVQAFYNLSPMFRGVGVSQVLFSLAVLACMTRFLGWLFLYIFHLFWTIQADRPGLPWLNCKGFPELHSSPCRDAGSMGNFSHDAHTKLSTITEESSLMQFMTALERPSESIAYFGEFQWWIFGAQGVVWVLVFIAVCCGVRWLGKVMPFTFVMSFALLLALMTRALTLDGLVEILELYRKATNWERLMDYNLWKLAVEQAILATGLGYGAFITIGSYNKRSNNLVGDSLLILMGHALLSFLQLITVVGFVGFVAVKTGLKPIELLDKGETQMWHMLAYLSYVPLTRIWSGLLLFGVVFTLLNVFYLLALTVLATLEDALGERWSRCFPRFVLALFTAGLCFSLSLYFSTQAGRHAYELATGFLKYVTLWAILTFELLIAGWFYCAHRLGMDLHTMLRHACCWCLGHFILLFVYLLPVVPAAIGVINVLDYDFSVYSEAIKNWEWSECVGAAVAIVPLLPIPIWALCAFLRACCCCRGCARCCCGRADGDTKCERFASAIRSPLRDQVVKCGGLTQSSSSNNHPRYSTHAPGYLLLPQAPLAQPEYT